MMAAKIALCVDELSNRNPELIGLDGEVLESQEWLGIFSNGDEVRRAVADPGGFSEAWVVSCDDVEPINLAASIKSDQPEMRVCLVTSDACGSLLSRAHNAQIDEVVGWNDLPRRYADAKSRMRAAESAQDGGTPLLEAAAPVLAPVMEAVEDPEAPKTAHMLQLQPRPRPVAVQSSSRAFVMPVVSGSGGAGKSAVSALGALIAQRMGYRTLLLDYDLQFGDVADMVGVEEPLRIDAALSRPDQLELELSRDDRIAVLAPPARLEAAEEAVRGLPDLLETLSGEFDVIVANTGAAWAEQHAALLERSSAALFLVDQRASSVKACKHALELCARCGIATGPFQFALNRCAKGAPLTSVDVSCALQGAPVFELKDGGRDVEDYLSGGAASELIDMRNEFARSLEQVMERLLPAGAIRPVEHQQPEPDRRAFRRRGRHADRKRGWR